MRGVNLAYAHAAPNGGRLHQPVLFINGEFDGLCNINHNRVGEPMRGTCENLSVTSLPSGHWLPLERKAESIQAMRSWLKTKRLQLGDTQSDDNRTRRCATSTEF